MKNLFKIFVVSFVSVFLGVLFYPAAEPMLAQAVADQMLVTQTVTSGISISNGADIALTALGTGINTAVGSTTWTVITNNNTGYTLTIAASSTPAMTLNGLLNGPGFADYTGALIPWTVSGAYQFGFSALGSNTTGYGTDAESNCATAVLNTQSTTLGWKGFTGVTPIQIASSTTVTSTAGTVTTFCVGTEQNGVFAPSGAYSATTTATATTNP